MSVCHRLWPRLSIGLVMVLIGVTSEPIICAATDAMPVGGAQEDGPRDQDMERICSWVARVGAVAQEKAGAEELAKECDQQFEQLPRVQTQLAEPLLFYRAVLAFFRKEPEEFTRLKQETIGHDVFDPELLLYESQMQPTDEQHLAARIAVWDGYGALVPLSLFGTLRDGREAPTGRVDPPPPSVPFLMEISERLAKIAVLYEESGSTREAVNLYVESLYAMPFTVSRSDKAATWIKIARLEGQLRQKALTIRALLKAVYNDPKLMETVMDGIAGIMAEKKTAEGKVAEVKLNSKTALAIAQLYREMNLHPLALRVLAAVPRDAQVDSARQQIEAEWLQIVQSHIAIRGVNAHILGVKAADVKSWEKVHVPRPSDTFWKPQ